MTVNLINLWENLSDISIDENECIKSNFYIWPLGTSKIEIWNWFDENFETGVVGLMFGKGK